MLQQLSVRAKLVSMMVLTAASLAFLGLFFLESVNEIKGSGPIYAAIARELDLRSDILPPAEFIVETHLTVLQLEKAVRSDRKQVDVLLKNLNVLKHDYDDRQSYWERALPSETPLEVQIRDGILKRSREPATQYFEILAEQFLPAIARGDADRAGAIIDTQLAPLYLQHKAEIQSLADLVRQSHDLRVNQAEHTISFRIAILIAMIVSSVLLTFAVGMYLTRSITGPLTLATAGLERVATGDLTVFLDVHSNDEVGRLATALNQALEKLRSTLQEVATGAANANASSHELAAAADAIARGAQQQAASLEETSASLEQITATVRQSADNAQQTKQVASGSREFAEAGQEVVVQAVTAMAQINVASAKISDIISTIDEIAFQTNLLAVNAAVEAARAGEEGRGFAVVATEVRSLAQRSAGAAKEIKTLIQDSLRKVEKGSELVNKSGETLRSIVASVKGLTDIVKENATAAAEQSSGIEQVNTAMTQMDRVTQANSAQTEQLATTAQTLSEQSLHIMELVGAFVLSKDGQQFREPSRALRGATSVRHPATPRSRVGAGTGVPRSQSNGSGASTVRQTTAAYVATLGGGDDGSFEEF